MIKVRIWKKNGFTTTERHAKLISPKTQNNGKLAHISRSQQKPSLTLLTKIQTRQDQKFKLDGTKIKMNLKVSANSNQFSVPFERFTTKSQSWNSTVVNIGAVDSRPHCISVVGPDTRRPHSSRRWNWPKRNGVNMALRLWKGFRVCWMFINLYSG